jgi:hypothetical protein
MNTTRLINIWYLLWQCVYLYITYWFQHGFIYTAKTILESLLALGNLPDLFQSQVVMIYEPLLLHGVFDKYENDKLWMIFWHFFVR